MHHQLNDLLQAISIQSVATSEYQGCASDSGWRHLFGGQLLAQATGAAMAYAPTNQLLHSFHAYFLRLANCNDPLHYQVHPLREGLNFTCLQVHARQQQELVFHATASFYGPQRSSHTHQPEMPAVPPPEQLVSDREMLQAYVKQLTAKRAKFLPPIVLSRIEKPQVLDIRPIHPRNFLLDSEGSQQRSMWMRFQGNLPDNQALHNQLLGYASDFSFLGTALQPHHRNTLSPGVRAISLDHAIWFHQPFRMDQWHLFSVHRSQCANSRALVHGEFFSRDGVLVASCSQEGFIRSRERPR